LEIEAKKVRNSYGKLYLLFIDNVPLFTQINGKPIREFRKRHRITEKGRGETNHIY